MGLYLTLSQGLGASNTGDLLPLSVQARGVVCTTNEHGFATLSCVIPLTTTIAFMFYDRPGLPRCTLTSDKGQTVWDGRVEDVAVVPGGLAIQAFGYWRVFSEVLYSGTQTSVTADTIVGVLLERVNSVNSWFPNYTGLVQNPGVTLSATYADQYTADILQELCQKGDNQSPPRIWEAGVYEDQTLFFRPRGSAGRAWYIDVADPEIERTLDTLWNSAYTLYGPSTATAVSAYSQAHYGLTRQYAVRDTTDNATIAASVRDAFLAAHADPPPRSTVHFDRLYDANGVLMPKWMVRAGDTMTMRNLSPTLSTSVDYIRTFNVKATSYDVESDVMEVTPEYYRVSLANPVATLIGATKAERLSGDPFMNEVQVANPWTPAFTGLTVSGAVTITGIYYRRENLLHWAVGITAGGVNTSASTAGTTRINNLPIPLTQGCVCGAWDATNGASYGVGGGAPIDGANSMFTPTWAATNHTIVISGFYMV